MQTSKATAKAKAKEQQKQKQKQRQKQRQKEKSSKSKGTAKAKAKEQQKQRNSKGKSKSKSKSKSKGAAKAKTMRKINTREPQKRGRSVPSSEHGLMSWGDHCRCRKRCQTESARAQAASSPFCSQRLSCAGAGRRCWT